MFRNGLCGVEFPSCLALLHQWDHFIAASNLNSQDTLSLVCLSFFHLKTYKEIYVCPSLETIHV